MRVAHAIDPIAVIPRLLVPKAVVVETRPSLRVRRLWDLILIVRVFLVRFRRRKGRLGWRV